MPTLTKVKIVGIFTMLNIEHGLFPTLFDITNLETGSSRKLVGDEDVLKWVFVLVDEWEEFFIPVSRERERGRGLHP